MTELWHTTIKFLDDSKQYRAARPKDEASEFARFAIASRNVGSVAVTLCSGDGCFECAAFATGRMVGA